MTLQEIFENPDKTHLVIDFDQTIAKIKIDWKPWYRMMWKVVRKYDKNYEYQGKKVRRKLNEIISDFGEEARREINKKNSEYEIENTDGLILNDKLITLIRQSDKRIFLVTANSRELIEKYLKELGIFDKFEQIVTRDDVKFIKPATDALHMIYNPHVGKEKYVYIGDSYSDEESARNFGIDFYKVKRFY